MHLEKNIYKVPNLIFKINGGPLKQIICEKLLEISAQYLYFYKENLPHKSRFLNRKLLHNKTYKNVNICSGGPHTPFPP